MLPVRRYLDVVGQFDFVSEDDVMRSEAFLAGEVRIVEMVKGACEFRIAVVGVDTKLIFHQTFEGVGD